MQFLLFDRSNNFLIWDSLGPEYISFLDISKAYFHWYNLAPYFFVFDSNGSLVSFNLKLIQTLWGSGYSLNELSIIFYNLSSLNLKFLFLFKFFYVYFFDFVSSYKYLGFFFICKIYLFIKSFCLWHLLYIQIFWHNDCIIVLQNLNIIYYIFMLQEILLGFQDNFFILNVWFDPSFFILIKIFLIYFNNDFCLYWFFNLILQFLKDFFFIINNIFNFFLAHLILYLYYKGYDSLIFMAQYMNFNLWAFLYDKFQNYYISFWDFFFYDRQLAIGKFSYYSYYFPGYFLPVEQVYFEYTAHFYFINKSYASLWNYFFFDQYFKYSILPINNLVSMKYLFVDYFFYDMSKKKIILKFFMISLGLWIYVCWLFLAATNRVSSNYNFNNDFLWFKFREFSRFSKANYWWNYSAHYSNLKKFINKLDYSKVIDNKFFVKITNDLKKLYFLKIKIKDILYLVKLYTLYSNKNSLKNSIFKKLEFVFNLKSSVFLNFDLKLNNNIRAYYMFLFRYLKCLKVPYKLYVNFDYNNFIYDSKYSSFHETSLMDYYLLYLFISYSYDKTKDHDYLYKLFWQESEVNYLTMDSLDPKDNIKIYSLHNKFYSYLLFFDKNFYNNFNWLWFKDSGNFLFVKDPLKKTEFRIVDNYVVLSDRFLCLFMIFFWYLLIIFKYFKISLFSSMIEFFWDYNFMGSFIKSYANVSTNIEGSYFKIFLNMPGALNEFFYADKHPLYWWKLSSSKLFWGGYTFLYLSLKSMFLKIYDFFFLYSGIYWTQYIRLCILIFLILVINFCLQKLWIKKIKFLKRQNITILQKILKKKKIDLIILKKKYNLKQKYDFNRKT